MDLAQAAYMAGVEPRQRRRLREQATVDPGVVDQDARIAAEPGRVEPLLGPRSAREDDPGGPHDGIERLDQPIVVVARRPDPLLAGKESERVERERHYGGHGEKSGEAGGESPEVAWRAHHLELEIEE